MLVYFSDIEALGPASVYTMWCDVMWNSRPTKHYNFYMTMMTTTTMIVCVPSGCSVEKRVRANFGGASGTYNVKSEEKCVKQCIYHYPQCQAVDYNLHSKLCYWHGSGTGFGKFQSNNCCNRYEIESCPTGICYLLSICLSVCLSQVTSKRLNSGSRGYAS